MNNFIFCKTMQNNRIKMTVHLTNTMEDAEKHIAKSNFDGYQNIHGEFFPFFIKMVQWKSILVHDRYRFTVVWNTNKWLIRRS